MGTRVALEILLEGLRRLEIAEREAIPESAFEEELNYQSPFDLAMEHVYNGLPCKEKGEHDETFCRLRLKYHDRKFMEYL